MANGDARLNTANFKINVFASFDENAIIFEYNNYYTFGCEALIAFDCVSPRCATTRPTIGRAALTNIIIILCYNEQRILYYVGILVKWWSRGVTERGNRL